MIRAIIIDDEKHCVESLQIDLQKNCPDVEVVAACHSSKEGMQQIKTLKPDLVFLDIEMPWMNGFELLDMLKPIDFDVIFVTAYDSYAIQAFKVSAVDYLLKPIDSSSLIDAVARVKSRKENNTLGHLENLLANHFKPNNSKRISVPEKDMHHFIELSDIIFLESEGNYTRIFIESGDPIFVSMTLKSMEEKINDNQFVRTHQSYLVNSIKISKYIKSDGGYLILNNGKVIPVARSKRNEVKALLGN